MEGEQQFAIEPVIADLEAKKALIENTIQTLKALYAAGGETPLSVILGAQVTGGSLTTDRPAIEPEKISNSAFFGMRSVGEAAKKFLNLVKRKQTTKQIVDALERGGFPHQSKYLYGTVYNALQRDGEIIRIGSEWAIGSWYPGRGRRAKEEGTPKTPKAPPGSGGAVVRRVKIPREPVAAAG